MDNFIYHDITRKSISHEKKWEKTDKLLIQTHTDILGALCNI